MAHDLQFEFAEGVDATLDLGRMRAMVSTLLDGERPDGAALSVRFASDGMLQALNREHRGIDAVTDVLSFAAEEGEPFPTPDSGEGSGYLGDIAVSVEFAQRQAETSGVDLDAEVQHVVIHGVLHLLGYDHETDAEAAAMEALEEALLGPSIHQRGHHEDG